MFDSYETTAPYRCPRCGSFLLTHWQGKEGPNQIDIFIEGEVCRHYDHETPRFEISTDCDACGAWVDAEGVWEGKRWARTEHFRFSCFSPALPRSPRVARERAALKLFAGRIAARGAAPRPVMGRPLDEEEVQQWDTANLRKLLWELRAVGFFDLSAVLEACSCRLPVSAGVKLCTWAAQHEECAEDSLHERLVVLLFQLGLPARVFLSGIES